MEIKCEYTLFNNNLTTKKFHFMKADLPLSLSYLHVIHLKSVLHTEHKRNWEWEVCTIFKF